MIEHREQITVLLRFGMAVPLLYFGTQLLAAPFFPGYRFVTQVASILGSDLALHPWIFNLGAMLTGVLQLLAALGFLLAFMALRVHPMLTGLTVIAMTLGGLGSVIAGVFPLPDPRHGAWGIGAPGLILSPLLLTLALWKQATRGLQIYLVLSLLALGVLVLVRMGVIQMDLSSSEGLFQRLLVLAVLPQVGVGAWFLTQRLETVQNRTGPPSTVQQRSNT